MKVEEKLSEEAACTKIVQVQHEGNRSVKRLKAAKEKRPHWRNMRI